MLESGTLNITYWPFLEDARDPNAAWDLQGRLIFFTLYVIAWIAVVFAVYLYSRMSVEKRREVVYSPVVDEEEGLSQAFGKKPFFPQQQVQELFLEQVQRSPNATALVLPEEMQHSVTYLELMDAVQRLAAELRKLGATGQIVALCLPRSSAQIVSVLATLCAGGGYLPIDASAPEARKRFLLEDSRSIALVSEDVQAECHKLSAAVGLPWVAMSTARFGCFKTACPETLVKPSSESADVAMLIYTSGSTGEPKGIVYDHRHLLHGAWFWAEEHHITQESKCLFKSPYFWAVMEWELFPALIRGGSLVVASREGHKSPEYMARLINKHEVNTLMMTPSVLDLLLDIHDAQASKALKSLRYITTVGEPLRSTLAHRVMSSKNLSVSLRNFYGASESSCTIYEVPHRVDLHSFPLFVPAGTPQPHADVFIMEAESLRVVPSGESGEICFGGVLANRYWHLPELTASKFVDTADFGRIYRTGDLGRLRNGTLEVLGRLDRQLKINGVRIEPGEIEAVLQRFRLEKEFRSLEPIQSCVALGVQEQLVAFVSLKSLTVTVTEEELMAHCSKELMAAYLPKMIVILREGLPLLPNGKTDYGKLKSMAEEHLLEAKETVMDSLGQMRSMSRWAVLENSVIHRCYAFWMLGVLLDHYAWCAMSTDPQDPDKMRSLPFCSALASSRVAPWSEAIIRSIGNDQDLFGFIMLGAYQDSRPNSTSQTRKRATLVAMDYYLLVIYLLTALPTPQILGYLSGGWAYPDRTWAMQTENRDSNGWDEAYIQNSGTVAGHRWYLLMIFQSKLYLALSDRLQISPQAQVFIAILLSSVGPVFAGNTCGTGGYLGRFLLYWLLDGCYVWYRWVAWYGTFYVFCYHYLRQIVTWMSQKAPRGPVWSATATASSMVLGMMMALFHYPNQLLESGEDDGLQLVELLVTTLQPALFALGTVYWNINASWWGNTTLGCYVIHFLFRDRMTEAFQWLVPLLSWDCTGLLLPLCIVLLCFIFTSTVGPLGHYILVSPQLLLAKLKRRWLSLSKLGSALRTG